MSLRTPKGRTSGGSSSFSPDQLLGLALPVPNPGFRLRKNHPMFQIRTRDDSLVKEFLQSVRLLPKTAYKVR